MQTVRLGASRYPIRGWIENGRQFRLKLSKNTFVSWRSGYAELWFLYMSNNSQTQQPHPTLYYKFLGSFALISTSIHTGIATRPTLEYIAGQTNSVSSPPISQNLNQPRSFQSSQSNFRFQQPIIDQNNSAKDQDTYMDPRITTNYVGHTLGLSSAVPDHQQFNSSSLK